tara:strand:+ start:600 stop:1001 length:402 start_codon:yes stop_codon:yes gene_type:complete
MLVSIKLSQTNKKGNETFAASAQISTGEDTTLNSVSKNAALFITKFIELDFKNKELGYRTLNSIKKSQPLNLVIASIPQIIEGEETEIESDFENIELNFRNFGKLAEKLNEQSLHQLFIQNIEFVETFVNWGK